MKGVERIIVKQKLSDVPKMEDLQRGHVELERGGLTISVLFHIVRKSQQKTSFGKT